MPRPNYLVSLRSPLTQAADVYSLGVLAWFIAGGGSLPAFLAKSTGVKGVAYRSIGEIVSALPGDLVQLIDKTLNADPPRRPTAATLATRFERQLLFGQHRALISDGAGTRILSKVGEDARLIVGHDMVTIRYDGLAFSISAMTGNVSLNNQPISVGQVLPGSCVITLGGPELGFQRTFVPIDMSHPGVVI